MRRAYSPKRLDMQKRDARFFPSMSATRLRANARGAPKPLSQIAHRSHVGTERGPPAGSSFSEGSHELRRIRRLGVTRLDTDVGTSPSPAPHGSSNRFAAEPASEASSPGTSAVKLATEPILSAGASHGRRRSRPFRHQVDCGTGIATKTRVPSRVSRRQRT